MQIENETFIIRMACLLPSQLFAEPAPNLSNCFQTKNCKSAYQPGPYPKANVSRFGKLPTPLTTDNQPATNIPLFVHIHLDDGLSIDEATLKLVKELRTYLVTAQALHLPKDTLAGIVL